MPSHCTHQKGGGKSKRVFQLWRRGFAASPDRSAPDELPEMASLFHACFHAEGTLICGKSQTWKHCGKDWASPAPTNSPLLQLHGAVGDNPSPRLSWDDVGDDFPIPHPYVPGLLPATSGMWAPMTGKSNCHHTAHMLGEASCLPGAVPSLRKAECALRVAQYPHGKCLPCPKEGQKEGEVPTAFSAALPNTHYQGQRKLTWSLKVLCMYQWGSAGLLASCAGRAPLNLCFW